MSKKKLDKKVLILTYNAIIKTIDTNTGEVKDEETIHNTVVNDGLERVAKLLGGVDAVNDFGYIAVGEGSTASQATDTELGNESKRDSAIVSYEANYKCKFEKLFTFGSAESYTITEAGIFDSITASGSTMLNRLVFAGKAVDSDTDLSVSITITVS